MFLFQVAWELPKNGRRTLLGTIRRAVVSSPKNGEKGKKMESIVWSWLAATALAAVVFTPALLLVSWMTSRSDFKIIFRFLPSSVPGMRDLEQAQVDNVLVEYARDFRVADEQERKILARPPMISEISRYIVEERLKEYETELKTAQRVVRSCKKDFWRAHKLAKRKGYEVYEKYTDYLPSPQNPNGLATEDKIAASR